MNAIRLAVGVLFVVMASKACTLAMAQDVKQSPEPSIRLTDPPEHSVIVSDAEGETANRGSAGRPRAAGGERDGSRSRPNGSSGRQQGSKTPSVTKCRTMISTVAVPLCNDACPSVYGQVEALFLMREPRFTQQPIVVDATTNTTLLSTSDLDFNFEPGVRATVGMRLCEGRALEFSYFGLWQGDASAVVVAPNDEAYLIFPDNLVGNVFVDMDERSCELFFLGAQFRVEFALLLRVLRPM